MKRHTYKVGENQNYTPDKLIISKIQMGSYKSIENKQTSQIWKLNKNLKINFFSEKRQKWPKVTLTGVPHH